MKNKDYGNQESIYKDDSHKIWYLIGIVSLIIALVVPFLVLFFSDDLKAFNDNTSWVKTDMTSLAAIGDFLTGTTFLLAFASIMFVIATFKVQQSELRQNTKVLIESKGEYEESNRLTREQITDAKEHYQKLNLKQDIQMFETSFFNLIDLLNTIKNETIIVKEYNQNYEEEFTEVVALKAFYNATRDLDEKLPNSYLQTYFQIDKPRKKLFDDYNYVHFRLNNNEIIENPTKEQIDEFIAQLEKSIRIQQPSFTLSQIIEFLNIHDMENEFVCFIKNNFRSIISDIKLEIFSKFDKQYNAPISPFVKTFLTIIKLIDSRNEVENKDFYISILTSQLKHYELVAVSELIIADYNTELRELSYKYPMLNVRTKLDIQITRLENKLAKQY